MNTERDRAQRDCAVALADRHHDPQHAEEQPEGAKNSAITSSAMRTSGDHVPLRVRRLPIAVASARRAPSSPRCPAPCRASPGQHAHVACGGRRASMLRIGAASAPCDQQAGQQAGESARPRRPARDAHAHIRRSRRQPAVLVRTWSSIVVESQLGSVERAHHTVLHLACARPAFPADRRQQVFDLGDDIAHVLLELGWRCVGSWSWFLVDGCGSGTAAAGRRPARRGRAGPPSMARCGVGHERAVFRRMSFLTAFTPFTPRGFLPPGSFRWRCWQSR